MEIERGLVSPELRFTNTVFNSKDTDLEKIQSVQSLPAYSNRNIVVGITIIILACIYWKYHSDTKKKRLSQLEKDRESTNAKALQFT